MVHLKPEAARAELRRLRRRARPPLGRGRAGGRRDAPRWSRCSSSTSGGSRRCCRPPAASRRPARSTPGWRCCATARSSAAARALGAPRPLSAARSGRRRSYPSSALPESRSAWTIEDYSWPPPCRWRFCCSGSSCFRPRSRRRRAAGGAGGRRRARDARRRPRTRPAAPRHPGRRGGRRGAARRAPIEAAAEERFVLENDRAARRVLEPRRRARLAACCAARPTAVGGELELVRAARRLAAARSRCSTPALAPLPENGALFAVEPEEEPAGRGAPLPLPRGARARPRSASCCAPTAGWTSRSRRRDGNGCRRDDRPGPARPHASRISPTASIGALGVWLAAGEVETDDPQKAKDPLRLPGGGSRLDRARGHLLPVGADSVGRRSRAPCSSRCC